MPLTRRRTPLIPSVLALASLALCARTQGQALPQGWRITPVGQQIRLPGDFPSRILLTKDQEHLLVLTSGFHHQGITIIDCKSAAIVRSVNLGKAYGDVALQDNSGQLFITTGGAVSAPAFKNKLLFRNEQLSSADFDAAILRAVVQHGQISMQSAIRIPGLPLPDQYTTGIAIAQDGALFLVNINNDTVYKLSPRSYTIEASATSGYGAFRAALSPDGNLLAISNWGDESVSLFTSAALKPVARVKTGSHPNDLAFGRDGRLFVANSGSNSVSVIERTRVVETIKTSLRPSDPVGSTPDALAIDSVRRRLYVANADNNDISVIDIARRGHSVLKGFIPTGWYPSALAVSRDGNTLYVGVAKGLRSGANVPASAPARRHEPYGTMPYDYVGDTLTGYVSIVRVPGEQQLQQLTRQVIRNFPASDQDSEEVIHARRIQSSVFPRIRHVLYIIRENRTYDQVLGDLGKGNSDPALTLFGENITPNGHRIARQWVLFDNLFVNGEVSENGHQWSNAAYATDFTSEAWLQSYSGRPEPKAHESELGADERLRSSPGGYLWDNCARHGLTFRTYGEFAYFHSGSDEGPRFAAKGLEGHASVQWLKLASSGWTDVSKGRDPDLARVFIREMHQAEQTGNWPRFMVMSLGEDHTHALRPGNYTPAAMVASNDQALGEIVDAVSHSKFWPETAIFVIEDDAQDGPDHVDSRRTVGLVISPYIKKNMVDSTQYSTASMIRTIELILGLPPMTQFDRAATPMYRAFTSAPDFTPYSNLPPRTDVFAKNPAKGSGAEASLRLDFSGYDRADPKEMNRILWEALKPGIAMPAPVRSAALSLQPAKAIQSTPRLRN